MFDRDCPACASQSLTYITRGAARGPNDGTDGRRETRGVGGAASACTGQLSRVWISKAAATQRAGRTARVRPGVVYRVYPAALYARMEEFEASEMHRQPLDRTVLQLRHWIKQVGENRAPLSTHRAHRSPTHTPPPWTRRTHHAPAHPSPPMYTWRSRRASSCASASSLLTTPPSSSPSNLSTISA